MKHSAKEQGEPTTPERGFFTLDDFRAQMRQGSRLGSIWKIMSFIPGMEKIAQLMGDTNADPDTELRHVAGIIDSMTLDERRNPTIITPSRRRRIASGAGVEPQEISNLVKSFLPLVEMIKTMGSMSMRDRIKALNSMTLHDRKKTTRSEWEKWKE